MKGHGRVKNVIHIILEVRQTSVLQWEIYHIRILIYGRKTYSYTWEIYAYMEEGITMYIVLKHVLCPSTSNNDSLLGCKITSAFTCLCLLIAKNPQSFKLLISTFLFCPVKAANVCFFLLPPLFFLLFFS